MTIGVRLINYLILTKSMGLIFGWSCDSNMQLSSQTKSKSSQSLEREQTFERDAS